MWQVKDGSGIWTNYVNPDTGEESVKEHELKVVKQWCAEHRFSGEIPANRMITCLDCGQEVLFVVGRDRMENGRVVRNELKS